MADQSFSLSANSGTKNGIVLHCGKTIKTDHSYWRAFRGSSTGGFIGKLNF